MLAFAEVPIGGAAIRCRRCPGGEVSPDAPVAAIADGVRRAAGRSGGCVALAGGDLLAREDWTEVLAASLGTGARRLRVDVGPSLSEPGLAARALSHGVRHVRVSVLTVDPDAGDSLAGIPGCAEAVLGGVDAFVGAADAMGIRAAAGALVPVCRHNLHDLPATVTALAEAGTAMIELRVTDPSLPAAPTAPWLAAAADSGTVNRAWVMIAGFPADALPGYGLHFTEPFSLGGAA